MIDSAAYMNELLPALQCLGCKGRQFIVTEEAIVCDSCSRSLPISHGVVNSMTEPDSAVINELRGMMREAGMSDHAPVDDYVIRKVGKISTQSERVASLKGTLNYYLSTEMNVRRALESVSLAGGERVLEIGAQDDFPFLSLFRERGCQCIATNIFFVYDNSSACKQWPYRVVSDMHRLAFADDFFDVVLVSATSHHSFDLDTAIREFARVTRTGGTILILNDPIGGFFKHLWDFTSKSFRKGGARHSLINENEYSRSLYWRLFRKHHLTVEESFFSAFYEHRLTSGEVSGVRFAPVARFVSLLWRVAAIRRFLKTWGLLFGQWLIGLEMNVILKKAPIQCK